MKIELATPQNIILNEIQKHKFTQKSVALTYAFCLRQANEVDFAIINKAIVERWSLSGLERVKKMAWKHLDE